MPEIVGIPTAQEIVLIITVTTLSAPLNQLSDMPMLVLIAHALQPVARRRCPMASYRGSRVAAVPALGAGRADHGKSRFSGARSGAVASS